MSTTRPLDAWKDLLIVALSMPFIVFFAAVTSAWPLMLGLGVVHSTITARCPALGFWATLALSWALGVLIAKFRPTTAKRAAR